MSNVIKPNVIYFLTKGLRLGHNCCFLETPHDIHCHLVTQFGINSALLLSQVQYI